MLVGDGESAAHIHNRELGLDVSDTHELEVLDTEEVGRGEEGQRELS